MKLTFKRTDKIEGFDELPMSVHIEFDELIAKKSDFDRDVKNAESINLDGDGDCVEVEFDNEVFNNELWALDVVGRKFKISIFVASELVYQKENIPISDSLVVSYGLNEKHRKIAEDELGIIRILNKNNSDDKAQEAGFSSSVKGNAASAADLLDSSQLPTSTSPMVALVGGVCLLISIVLFVLQVRSDHHPKTEDDLLMSVFAIVLMISGAVALYSSRVFTDLVMSRCEKCNSSKVFSVGQDEEYKGTYSKQEMVRNRSTNELEWRQVTVSDFKVNIHYRCGLCGNTWVNSHTRTTDGS